MITDVDPVIAWHVEFAKVISCTKCSKATDRNLMRDSGGHVPQPGYIRRGYHENGLLLVGQNPYLPNAALAAQDRAYTAALRALRDSPIEQEYARLQTVLRRFIPRWPVQNNYFPLVECGLTLDDIAYVNLVRCRTGEEAPNASTVEACRRTHFEPWLDMLAPACVVFIGLWARERGRQAVATRRVPYAAIDRNRSLTASQRIENRTEVAEFVGANIASSRASPNKSTGMSSPSHRNHAIEDKVTETDPKQTIAILDSMQEFGFNDDAFFRLHHYWLKKKKMNTIRAHRIHCEKTHSFPPGHNNVLVYRRLAFVLKAYLEPGNKKDWIALADEASVKIPPLDEV